MQILRLSRLPRQLPRNSPLHLPDGVRPGREKGDLQCLARALCRFRWLPYGTVPSAERKAYVRLQLLTWSPFEASGYAVVDGRNGAMAFAWDQRAFEERALAAGLPIQPSRILPETLLLPAHDDGVVLRVCSIGVEGQVWRDRQIVASRWWLEAPDEAAWFNFQRSAGVHPDAQRERPPLIELNESPQWLDEPWAPVLTLSAMMERARLRLHALLAVVLTALLLPTLWLLHANWQLAREIDTLRAEKEKLTAEAEPILTARSQAIAAMAEIDTLRAAVMHPDALLLLSHVAAKLPGDGSRLRNFEIDGRRLRLALVVPATTPRITYVRALEGGGWLQELREDTQDATPGLITLTAEIVGSSPPPAVSEAAGAASELARPPMAAASTVMSATSAGIAASASVPAPGVGR